MNTKDLVMSHNQVFLVMNDEIPSLVQPPGTAESQIVVLSAADVGDVSTSSLTGGMDVDQKLSPVALTSFEGVNLPSVSLMEDIRSKDTESTMDVRSSVAGNLFLPPSTGKFDYLTKAEAMMSFAPEYAAVETPVSEFSTSIFKSPYLPRSKRVEILQSSSSAYAYSMVPSSPCLDMSEEKLELSAKVKLGSAGQDTHSCPQSLKLYNHVQGGTKKSDNKLINDEISSHKADASSLSGMNSSSVTFTPQRKNEKTFETGVFFFSLRTTLATEIECVLFQAAMCRIRHTLLSLRNRVPFGLSKLSGNVMPDLASCVTSNSDMMLFSKYNTRTKDSIPARITGEVDGGILEEPVTKQVGVWRSVGVPKGTNVSNMHITENSSLLVNHISSDDGLNFSEQRQPLQDFLDAMPLLVQQSTSFVDVLLDMDDCESSFCWLALQEQQRREFSCGPCMVHAGCGGLLATCHYVDIAGVDLIDPLSADVSFPIYTLFRCCCMCNAAC